MRGGLKASWRLRERKKLVEGFGEKGFPGRKCFLRIRRERTAAVTYCSGLIGSLELEFRKICILAVFLKTSNISLLTVVLERVFFFPPPSHSRDACLLQLCIKQTFTLVPWKGVLCSVPLCATEHFGAGVLYSNFLTVDLQLFSC